jgi:hypothetical protein
MNPYQTFIAIFGGGRKRGVWIEKGYSRRMRNPRTIPHQEKRSGPGGIRTPDIRVRSPALYPG